MSSPQAGGAAQELERASEEVIEFIRSCPEEAWQRKSEGEGWTIAAIATHCALGNDVALGWICQMLAGRAVLETPDTHNAANAADAGHYAGKSKDEAIATMRRTSARSAAFLRALTDEELERGAHHGLLGREVTVGRFLPNFSGHMRGHLDSARATTRTP